MLSFNLNVGMCALSGLLTAYGGRDRISFYGGWLLAIASVAAIVWFNV